MAKLKNVKGKFIHTDTSEWMLSGDGGICRGQL